MVNYNNAWNGQTGARIVSTDQRIPVTVLREKDDMFEPLSVMESAEEKEDRLIAEFAGMQQRALAMAAVLEWAYSLNYTADNLHTFLAGAVLESADSDMDDENYSEDDEEEYDEEEYDDIEESAAAAMIALGADRNSVFRMFNTGDDAIAESIGNYLLDRLDQKKDEPDSRVIAKFAVMEDAVFESMVKKVVGGEVVFKPKKKKKRVRRTAEQKAAMKKMLRKAHTGEAKKNRAKSMKVRRQHGM